MKVWDVSQMGYMENFFGHRSTGLQLDALNSENMVSCGFDRVAIVWKIPQQYQLIFKERSYSLDTVVALDQRHFATGSQDGEVCLFSLDKVKPMSSVKNAHPGGWIGALATNYNSDMLVSGGWDDQLNFYQLDLQKNSIEKKFDVRCVDCK